jgi:hypothetical protein
MSDITFMTTVYHKVDNQYIILENHNVLDLNLKIITEKSYFNNERIYNFRTINLSDKEKVKYSVSLDPEFDIHKLKIKFLEKDFSTDKYVLSNENILFIKNLTLVFSFSRCDDMVVFPSLEYFVKENPCSCILPQSKYLLHVYPGELFMRP